MNKQIKKKLIIILIICILAMIPLIFILKMSYGVYLKDRALDKTYGSHMGKTELEAAQESIKDLEKAKKFYKTNQLIYFNQAKMYVLINDYKKAIKTIEDFIEIDSDKDKAYSMLGILNELEGNKEKARSHYLKYKNLRNKKYQIENLNNQELKGLRIEEAMDYFFLQDTLSFKLKTNELIDLYPNDDYLNGLYDNFKKVDRLEILKEMLQ